MGKRFGTPTTLGSSSGWGVFAGTPTRKVSQPDDSRIGPDRRIHRTAALDDPYGPGTVAGTDDLRAVEWAGGERRKPFGGRAGAIGAGHIEEDFAALILEQARNPGIRLEAQNVPVDDGLSPHA
ncbi:hypothetical protein [Kitasatospora sp. NPDC058190]|uniref:hypothetical protein n=1 Tax=Kitasatospora sp. NPDC058190 TaxID=3346371 RepID=UPI0036DB9CCD